jgi:hypothetical protein
VPRVFAMTRKNKPDDDWQARHDAEWRARMDSYFLNDHTKPAVPPVRPEIIKEIQDKAAKKAAREKASRGGIASGEKRREAPSPNPIIESMTKKLDRDPNISGRDMVAALKAVAENGLADGSIIMSADSSAFVVMDNERERYRLAVKSVPPTISRLRKINS